MLSALLRSGEIKNYTPLGQDGMAVYTVASQLRDALKFKRGRSFAEYLAIPQRNEQGDRIDWYVPFDSSRADGQYMIIPWTSATEEERENARSELKIFERTALELGKELIQSPSSKGDQLLFARLLCGGNPDDITDPENVRKAMKPNTRVVYLETPANPTLKISDVRKISEIAHENKDCMVFVDNTFCTPFIQRPLTLGADVVLHSATKYLNGHGDVVAGFVAGSAEFITQVKLFGIKDMTGAVLSAFDAFLIGRGLKTLEVRMKQHCANAKKVAEFLEEHKAVDKVFYPGLDSFEQKELAASQMQLPGAMIAFELKGGVEEGKKFNKPVEEMYFKSDELDDPFINESQALALEIATKEDLNRIWDLSRKVNTLLTDLFKQAGMKLVDFKLEFGTLADGTLVLADEFSPDNCRLWDLEDNRHLDKDVYRRDIGDLTPVYEEVLNRLKKVLNK